MVTIGITKGRRVTRGITKGISVMFAKGSAKRRGVARDITKEA